MSKSAVNSIDKTEKRRYDVKYMQCRPLTGDWIIAAPALDRVSGVSLIDETTLNPCRALLIDVHDICCHAARQRGEVSTPASVEASLGGNTINTTRVNISSTSLLVATNPRDIVIIVDHVATPFIGQ